MITQIKSAVAILKKNNRNAKQNKAGRKYWVSSEEFWVNLQWFKSEASEYLLHRTWEICGKTRWLDCARFKIIWRTGETTQWNRWDGGWSRKPFTCELNWLKVFPLRRKIQVISTPEMLIWLTGLPALNANYVYRVSVGIRVCVCLQRHLDSMLACSKIREHVLDGARGRCLSIQLNSCIFWDVRHIMSIIFYTYISYIFHLPTVNREI